MKKKPSYDESNIVGSWIAKDGAVTQDSICDRILWLTESFFEQVAVDGDNWSVLYQNPEDGRYWELTYPQSHMHGGGPPTLKCLSEDDACDKYKIGN